MQGVLVPEKMFQDDVKSFPILDFDFTITISGFRDGADHFFIFMLALYMTCLASASLGFLFSSIAPVTAIANVMTAMATVVMMVSITLSYQEKQ